MFKKLAKKINDIADKLDKYSSASKLYEYEIEGFKFYSSEKMPSGIRLPVGKAEFTKNFFNTTGELSKSLEESNKGESNE
jgi:hypothetical protein